MASGKKIERIQIGNESLVSARRANELVDVLNAIIDGVVAPIANVGDIKFTGGRFIIDLSVFDGRVRALETGAIQNIANCCGALEVQINSLQTQIDTIISRLDNASINASCNGSSINVALSL